MPGVPSVKKCQRCREKHLKCDLTRPRCRRCINANVDCPGYSQNRKFIDQGADLRRRYAPYRNASSRNDSLPATSPNGLSSTSNDAGVSSPYICMVTPTGSHSGSDQDRPGHARGVSPVPIETTGGRTRSGRNLRAQRTASNRDRSCEPNSLGHPASGRVDAISEYGEGEIESFTARNDATRSSNTSGGNDTPITSTANTQTPGISGPYPPLLFDTIPPRHHQESFRHMPPEPATEMDRENFFLARQYCDTIGTWLDISDTNRFYSLHVPIRAVDDIALRYAIAAITSKRLGRVKGSQLDFAAGGTGFNTSQIDWSVKATTYHHMTVTKLSRATGGNLPVLNLTRSGSLLEGLSRWLEQACALSQLNTQTKGPGDKSLLHRIENLLSSLVLLTMYELMDADISEWRRHLFGIHALFDCLLKSSTDSEGMFSHGIRASFWILARQDFASAYFDRFRTQIDPDNHRLWHAAGITIDEDNQFQIVPPKEAGQTIEEQATGGILWLIFKIVNLLARVKQAQLYRWAGQGTRVADNLYALECQEQAASPEIWLQLCFDLQAWLEKSPEMFRASARINCPDPSDQAHLNPFPTIFYALPACAGAIQQYHFGRIALLLNQPNDAINTLSVSFDRLHGYREVTRGVEHHCRELCGIAVGSPYAALRLQMMPLLYAVGNCLERPSERETLLGILNSVESDLGWASEYVTRPLHRTWLGNSGFTGFA